jgi:hypothetical protein
MDRSRQVGPCTGNELHALLAKGDITHDTLVWTRDSGGWRPLRDLTREPDEPAPRVRPKLITLPTAAAGLSVLLIIAGLVMHGLSPASDAERQNPSTPVVAEASSAEALTGAVVQLAAIPSGPSQAAVTRKALHGEERREMEFWRSIAGSNDADLYEIYLERYPTGSFADIATAKLQALGPRKAALADPESETSSKSGAAKQPSRKKLAKPARLARCWKGNIGECRERCRNGELSACQALTKFSR